MPVSNAQIDTISTKMEFAVRSKVLANSSTFKKESAKNVIKDTQS